MAGTAKRPEDMINNSNLGKWMSWDDIVRIYPNRWVFITNYEKNEKNSVVGGILEAVCKDPEVDLLEDILTSKRGYFERTTEIPGNVLWVE